MLLIHWQVLWCPNGPVSIDMVGVDLLAHKHVEIIGRANIELIVGAEILFDHSVSSSNEAVNSSP